MILLVDLDRLVCELFFAVLNWEICECELWAGEAWLSRNSNWGREANAACWSAGGADALVRWGLGLGVWGLGFGVWGLGEWGMGFGVFAFPGCAKRDPGLRHLTPSA